MGNICRSPMALAVAQHMVRGAGGGFPKSKIQVLFDSAGTHAHHIGEAIDERAKETLARRGYGVKQGRSRKVTVKDFSHFDLILAMDKANVSALTNMCPPEHRHKIRRLLDYADGAVEKDILDPYYGNAAGFEHVLDLCEIGVSGLIRQLPGERVA